MQLCAKDVNVAFIYAKDQDGKVDENPKELPTSTDGPLISVDSLSFY